MVITDPKLGHMRLWVVQGFAGSHNSPWFAFPREISSPLCRDQVLRNLSLLLSYLEGVKN